MPVSNEELYSIKFKQYVLIARAGLSLPSHEMDSASTFANMFIQFKRHLERVKLPQGFAKNNFFRTSRHLNEAVTDKKIHDGASLWRKFCAIKEVCQQSNYPYLSVVIRTRWLTSIGSDKGNSTLQHQENSVQARTTGGPSSI